MSKINLYLANQDILCILKEFERIGWKKLKEQTIHRVAYLAKVLYSFTNPDKNIFDYFIFSPYLTGPFSTLIENSLVDLVSNDYCFKSQDGSISFGKMNDLVEVDQKKYQWIKTIILILGKYGEDKVFGFTINDPLYNKAVLTNSQKELDTTSPDNATIEYLNKFKEVFEKELGENHQINDIEYLNLYFEYVFSNIIKG